ncbi:PAS domain-containing protein [Mucilaginibacter galii]|nr:PAS domain-containing protein [Mucilaginibacter galii]
MSNTPKFLQGGGHMGEFIRLANWAETSVGTPDTWSDSLRSAVSLSINSGFPIAIYWGSDFTLIYNDAWSTIPGNKHPWALGKPGAVVWPEIWDGLEQQFNDVLNKGQSIRQPDSLLLMNRYGYVEECYFDYTLSPITALDGSIGGVFNAVIETSYRVINERRNQVLTKLLQQLNRAHGLQEAINKVQSILDHCREDIPFYQLFSTDNENTHQALLTISSGLSPANEAAVNWPYMMGMNGSDAIYIEDLNKYLAEPALSTWGTPCTEALIVPVSTDEARIGGYLVMGVSPRKKLDADYRHFLNTVGLHTGTILNNGYSYELNNALMREQALNEELASANEELSSTNEELHISQQSLAMLNAELEERVANRTSKLAESENRFRNLIKDAPVAIAVFTSRSLVIESANNYMLNMWGKTSDVIGLTFSKAVPELVGQPFFPLLDQVFTNGNTYYGNESIATINHNGILTNGYYNFVYQPVKDESGTTVSIISIAHDVTEQVNARKKIEEVALSLRSLVMTAHYALMILRGQDWVIEIANTPLANLWGRTVEDITGRRLMDVLPELEGQPFPALLRRIFETGKGYGQEEEVFYLDSPEGPVTKYVSFYYDPVFDSEGNVTGIIVAAEDITNQVNNRLLLEQSYSEQQALNEELTAINEEVASANEELVTTNEELAHTKENLQEIVGRLATSEARIRYMIAEAPVAIGILTSQLLVIEAANNKILELWGKNSSIIGMPLQDALPELKGQPFLDILDSVYTSGQTYYGNEVHAKLERNGVLEELYFNFAYHPIFDDANQTSSIIVVATDVTEQVISRRKVENAEEMLRFSVDAANMGTWYLDVVSREFIPSTRLKELFGFNANDEVSYADVVNQIPEEYRQYIEAEVEKALANDDSYNVEHPVLGNNDHKIRWVRASGKLNKNPKDGRSYFSGVLIDITEQKQDEQRKNDFIGMVSHELKTPLTSLSAYIQMLHARAKKNDDNFVTGALDKVSIQVKKMSSMINGFLNVSRLESGKIHLDIQQFRLDELVKDMVDETILTTASHELVLLPCDAALVAADRDKIGSVISNLISNAIKYSPRGKRIEVNCIIVDEMARVSVKDEGMGIKPQDIEKLFERYYRVDSKHTQTISGFGIGLYLCAEIIQRHNGNIWVESEMGQGSTFFFSLPLA